MKNIKQPTKTQEFIQEQIASWKKEHGAINAFKIDGERVMVLRKPKIKDISRANAFASKSKDSYAFNDAIINSCVLYEKEGIRENDAALLGIYTQLDTLIEIADTEVEEL